MYKDFIGSFNFIFYSLLLLLLRWWWIFFFFGGASPASSSPFSFLSSLPTNVLYPLNLIRSPIAPNGIAGNFLEPPNPLSAS